ncbi:hypothetical protein [Ochrobactrum sp. POC9]|uniref:hypothetical protein n=1 Tax=Ochrobactrum sp. POC9 TaxID=2203419 RepID=UPI0011B27EE0|nr:hypothetical protein [Ochrobactrum sp. POC9]
MAKLPFVVSIQAIPIEAALAEGRTEDAKTMVVERLLSGDADPTVQKIAAELIKPKKGGRGRRKAHTRYWLDIGEMYNDLRDQQMKREEALAQVADHFGVSETHVRTAVKEYDAAKEAHDEASRNSDKAN